MYDSLASCLIQLTVRYPGDRLGFVYLSFSDKGANLLDVGPCTRSIHTIEGGPFLCLSYSFLG